MQLSGCGTALVTPFRDGALDEPALTALVRAQVAAGINLLIPCGTTGEAATLSEPEQIRVIELTIAAAQGKALVFAGCTLNDTRAAVARAQCFSKITGLTGILTANPYYNRPGQEGQYQHFRAIARAVAPMPVILYNIPGRTGANLEPATVLRLAAEPNILAIKESSGNLEQIRLLIDLLRINDEAHRLQGADTKAFSVLSGDDSLVLPILQAGGSGLISVASNVIPAEMSQLVAAALAAAQGDHQARARAQQLNQHWLPLMQAHFTEPSPAPVKAVLALLGRMSDEVRLPIVPVTEETREKLRTLLSNLKLL